MVKLDQANVFQVMRHAQKAGLLDLLPPVKYCIAPGERFFESVQSNMLEAIDLEKLDAALYNLAPAIRYMADEAHWEPAEFTSDEMFKAVRNLQRAGVFEISKAKPGWPGAGDRYFEHIQGVLVEKIGAERLDTALHILGQCIKFLASEASMVNVNTEGRDCA